MNLIFKIILIITLILFWAVIFYFLYLSLSPIDSRYGISDLLQNNTAIKENFINKAPGLSSANNALGGLCKIPGILCPYTPLPFTSNCSSTCEKDYGPQWHETGKMDAGCPFGQTRSLCSRF